MAPLAIIHLYSETALALLATPMHAGHAGRIPLRVFSESHVQAPGMCVVILLFQTKQLTPLTLSCLSVSE